MRRTTRRDAATRSPARGPAATEAAAPSTARAGWPGYASPRSRCGDWCAAGGRHLGVLEAPGERTYIVRGAERLLDGVVQAVTHEAVVFEEVARDAPAGSARREVRKVLAGAQEER